MDKNLYSHIFRFLYNSANSDGDSSSALTFPLMPKYEKASLTASDDADCKRFFLSIFLRIEKQVFRNLTKSGDRISALSVLKKLITADVVLG